ncbi:hypothetical protein TNIN_256061 [Trichonephila inaurata madagascariensis]|uniref:Uncharacterized protein n=1 Tax=Trichonephila inaurata madagascariensis TaxID=2747483 RepID=A0A8X6IZ57_9ARAC|nr:hypothetical protein TNIN_256061 [Trichonephila inaurata madagascariensis]
MLRDGKKSSSLERVVAYVTPNYPHIRILKHCALSPSWGKRENFVRNPSVVFPKHQHPPERDRERQSGSRRRRRCQQLLCQCQDMSGSSKGGGYAILVVETAERKLKLYGESVHSYIPCTLSLLHLLRIKFYYGNSYHLQINSFLKLTHGYIIILS